MLRSAFALLFVTAAVAAPVPKALKKQPDYYPLRLGDRWEYRRGSATETREVTAVTDNRDGSRTVRTLDGRVVGEFRVDADGVGMTEWSNNRIDPTYRIMTATLTAGAEWESKFRYSNSDWHYKYAVGEAEEVTVPAGTFRAVPVTSKRMGNGGAVQDTTVDWYAAGVGLVKSKHEGGTAKELVQFTPGK